MNTGWASNINSQVLKPILIEKGFCYVHNSFLGDHSATSYKERMKNLRAAMNRKVVVGRLDGIRQTSVTNMTRAFDGFWQSPDEVPDATNKPLAKAVDAHVQYAVKLAVTMTIVAAPEVRDLSVAQRKCRYADESNLAGSIVYSYKTCLVECRRRLAEKLCGCAPYFSHVPGGRAKECGVKGMLCLAQRVDQLVRLNVEACGCLPSCEVTTFSQHSVDIVGSSKFDGKISWLITEFPMTRYKRDLIFTFTDLLVSFGGTAGLFLGCSLISLIEIIYFFTLRLVMKLCKK